MSRQMKESRVEWIGEIPSTWEIKRNKFLLSDMYSGGTPTSSDEGLYSDNGVPFVSISDMSSVDFVVDTKKKLTDAGIKDKNLRILDEGTILYSIYATIGAISELKIKATISQAMLALTLKNDYCKSFYKYNLLAMRDYIFFNANGNTQFNLNAEKVWNFSFVVPSIKEQKRIASFLDSQCAHIDTVIEKTTASIEEYKKLKQAVITQAVTKGVRGDRPMKDSGNVWLGEIPIELMVSRVGLHFDIILGKMVCTEPKESNMTEYPYICAANVHFDGVDTINLKKMWFTENEIRLYEVKEGDLLVVEGGAGAGGCAIAREIEEIVGIQNSIQIVRPKNENSTEYLCYLLQALVKQKYVDVVCNKATIPHFTKDKLATVPFIMWSYEEQCEIVNYLDKKCNEIDILISSKEKFLDELVDYKKSLIYEYVTGKKEVPVS